MDRNRIGRCSICGGDVMAHTGAWWGINQPPGPECVSCGAVDAASDPVIPMSPRPAQRIPRIPTAGTADFIPPWGGTITASNVQWQGV